MNLQEILEKHKKWVNEEADGERANLSGANLSRTNLRDADLREANLSRTDLREANLSGANLSEANLHRADLSEANPHGARINGADLRGANLDYSAWPLWCGSLDPIIDKRIAAQLAYHFCRTICDDPEVQAAQAAIAGLANQFHRVDECGRIEKAAQDGGPDSGMGKESTGSIPEKGEGVQA